MDARSARIQRILDLTEIIIHQTNANRDRAWLNVDLTMPQLKTLICVAKHNGATSGQIASSLGVGLSTITGVVDRLVEQHLVTRHEDPRDRRITRVEPTQRGRCLVDDLLQFRDDMITAILSRLSDDELRTVETAFAYLQRAANDTSTQAKNMQSTEAVA
jgi:DNA-binding MarR family transcriptional regulator